MRQVPKLGKRLSQALLGDGELVLVTLVLGTELPACEPNRDRQRRQTLLGSIVQVPLERTALRIRCGDDPRARRAKTVEMFAPDRAQALVLEREDGGVGELGGHCGVFEQASPVHERRQLLPAGKDARDLSAPISRELGAPAFAVDPALDVSARMQQLE